MAAASPACAPTTSAPCRCARCCAGNAGVDWAAVDDVVFGCANQAGEDNRNVARMSALLAGPAGRGSGHHGQPLVRLGHGRHRHRRARDQGRRGRADAGGRRGEHEPGAVRHGQGRVRLRPRHPPLRHHHRLALRQSPAAGVVGINSMPQTADNVAADSGSPVRIRMRFALRSQQRWAAAEAAGFFEAEIEPVELPAKAASPASSTVDEHPRRTRRWSGSPASKASTARTLGHRRQCLGGQ